MKPTNDLNRELGETKCTNLDDTLSRLSKNQWQLIHFKQTFGWGCQSFFELNCYKRWRNDIEKPNVKILNGSQPNHHKPKMTSKIKKLFIRLLYSEIIIHFIRPNKYWQLLSLSFETYVIIRNRRKIHFKFWLEINSLGSIIRHIHKIWKYELNYWIVITGLLK